MGIEGELLLILYSMIDRHDSDSEFAPFWATLPKTHRTGDRFKRLLNPQGLAVLITLQSLLAFLVLTRAIAIRLTRPLAGLSMTEEDLEVLKGSPAADAIRAAQQVSPVGCPTSPCWDKHPCWAKFKSAEFQCTLLFFSLAKQAMLSRHARQESMLEGHLTHLSLEDAIWQHSVSSCYSAAMPSLRGALLLLSLG